ncbi:MAG: ComEC family competence protein, partial [Deltaproteobacteria bacterium]|nr:ComEC family competence protein [Deltaproteobacteria bacterium]
MSRPLVPVVLAFISGTIPASYGLIGEEIAFSLSIVFLLIFILGILRGWRFNIGVLSFFFLGALLGTQEANPLLPADHIKNLPGLLKDKVRVEGVLYRSPERLLDRTRLYIRGERVFAEDRVIPVSGNILVTVGDRDINLRYGDRVRFMTRLRIPRNLGNPGGFDYEGYLAREGIFVTGYVENGRWVVRMAGGGGRPFWAGLEVVRDRLRASIDSAGDNGILKALLIGEQGEIPRETRASFVETGTAHILAISGLHIAIIAFTAYWIIYRLLLLSERLMLVFNIKKVSALLSIPPVLFYGLIAGLQVSTQRAVLMVMVFILAILLDREREIYNTLAVAALVILIISPSAVYDISFQLSFISVLSIIYLFPRLKSLFGEGSILALPRSFLDKARERIIDLLLVSISASIGTAPVVAYHFHKVSTTGILANLVVVPVMGFLVVILGFLACIVLL